MFEPRVGFVFAFEAEYMMVPFENTRGAQPEDLAGAQLEATVAEIELLDKPETVELGLFAEGMVEDLDASAGQWLGFVAQVWVSTAGMGTDSGSNLGSKVEVVL